jgi:4'-phosphopantetheinyl transferase
MSRAPDVRKERHSVAKLDSEREDQKDARFFLMAPMRFLPTSEALDLDSVARVAPGEVHVWPLSLEADEAVRARAAALLDEVERQRAARYHFDTHRHHFILARGQMRHLLGLYCGLPAASIRFVLDPAGKPRLATDLPVATGVSFNLTHSGGRALLAVTHGPEIGVDLECHDRRTDVLPLAERYFSSPERAAIAAAPDSHQPAMFFRFWTAKEAVIKAHGEGLGVPLDAFSVAAVLASPDFVPVEIFDPAHFDRGWCVRSLPAPDGWSAALAARTPVRVRVMAPDSL